MVHVNKLFNICSLYLECLKYVKLLFLCSIPKEEIKENHYSNKGRLTGFVNFFFFFSVMWWCFFKFSDLNRRTKQADKWLGELFFTESAQSMLCSKFFLCLMYATSDVLAAKTIETFIFPYTATVLSLPVSISWFDLGSP